MKPSTGSVNENLNYVTSFSHVWNAYLCNYMPQMRTAPYEDSRYRAMVHIGTNFIFSFFSKRIGMFSTKLLVILLDCTDRSLVRRFCVSLFGNMPVSLIVCVILRLFSAFSPPSKVIHLLLQSLKCFFQLY